MRGREKQSYVYFLAIRVCVCVLGTSRAYEERNNFIRSLFSHFVIIDAYVCDKGDAFPISGGGLSICLFLPLASTIGWSGQ